MFKKWKTEGWLTALSDRIAEGMKDFRYLFVLHCSEVNGDRDVYKTALTGCQCHE